MSATVATRDRLAHQHAKPPEVRACPGEPAVTPSTEEGLGRPKLALERQHAPGTTAAVGVFPAACVVPENRRTVEVMPELSIMAPTPFVPHTVVGLKEATSLVAGDRFTCALTKSKEVPCWGANSSGQLGNRCMAPQKKQTVALRSGSTARLLESSDACRGRETVHVPEVLPRQRGELSLVDVQLGGRV